MLQEKPKEEIGIDGGSHGFLLSFEARIGHGLDAPAFGEAGLSTT